MIFQAIISQQDHNLTANSYVSQLRNKQQSFILGLTAFVILEKDITFGITPYRCDSAFLTFPEAAEEMLRAIDWDC